MVIISSTDRYSVRCYYAWGGVKPLPRQRPACLLEGGVWKVITLAEVSRAILERSKPVAGAGAYSYG